MASLPGGSRMQAAEVESSVSFNDRLCLVACREEGWTCVTNDGALRRLCDRRGVETRFSLGLSGYSGAIDRGSYMLRQLIRDILACGIQRGDVRSDLALDDITDVTCELFTAYADKIVAGERSGVSERRVEAIIETVTHGIIARPSRRAEGGYS